METLLQLKRTEEAWNAVLEALAVFWRPAIRVSFFVVIINKI